MTAPVITRPVLLSPCCRRPVEGGPVVFWCPGCRRDVHGSVIDREYTPRAADCSHLHGAFGPGCPYCTPVRSRS